MQENTQTLPVKLVLASSSPYRKRLLSRLQLAFECRSPSINEAPITGEEPPAMAMRLSSAKAKAVSLEGDGDALYIGSDQVAFCSGRLLGKPGSDHKAREQLAFCSGKPVTFITGLAIWRPSKDELRQSAVTTTVTLRPLSADAIARYIELDSPLDCAGSFKWESLGISLFESLVSEDPTALEGLPLLRLCQRLRAHGYALP